MEEKFDALVLRAVDYKDNDKILTLFAAGKGKMTAGGKGVRKATAQLKVAAQPFCFAEYVFAERAGRYTVTSAFLHDGFYPLRQDLTKFYAAAAVCEVCDGVLPEGLPADNLFISAIKTLQKLCDETAEPALPLLSFLLDTLRFAGYGLTLDGCVECGEEIKDGGYFDFERGGFTCSECPPPTGVGARASEVTYHALRYAAGKEEKAPTADGVKRALRLLKAYFAQKAEIKQDCLGEFIRLLP